MLKKVETIFIYFICLGLCVFYVFALYTAFQPDVSPEYTNYYITQSGRKWAGNDAYRYELGASVAFTAGNEDVYNRMGQGWSSLEEHHCWSDGESSELYFKGLPNKELKLKIKIADFISDDCEALVTVNDVAVGELDRTSIVPDGFCCLTIPEGLITDGYANIRFSYSNPQSLETDSRLLGMAVYEVVIDE